MYIDNYNDYVNHLNKLKLNTQEDRLRVGAHILCLADRSRLNAKSIRDNLVTAFNVYYEDGGTDSELIEVIMNKGVTGESRHLYLPENITELNESLVSLGYTTLREQTEIKAYLMEDIDEDLYTYTYNDADYMVETFKRVIEIAGNSDILDEIACRDRCITMGPHDRKAGNKYDIMRHLFDMHIIDTGDHWRLLKQMVTYLLSESEREGLTSDEMSVKAYNRFWLLGGTEEHIRKLVDGEDIRGIQFNYRVSNYEELVERLTRLHCLDDESLDRTEDFFLDYKGKGVTGESDVVDSYNAYFQDGNPVSAILPDYLL